MSITQETFDGLAFPVVRVRYSGPTNTRGSRWNATLRRDSERTYRASVPYRPALSTGARNAIGAAEECWRKCCADLDMPADEHLAIPGELDADSYSFTFVPVYFFPRDSDEFEAALGEGRR